MGLGLLRRNDRNGFDGAVVTSYNRTKWPASTPSVYVGTPVDPSPFGPTFASDNTLLCEMAADHLTAIGFPTVAYVGIGHNPWSADRFKNFEAAVCRRGRNFISCELPPRTETPYAQYVKILTRWFKTISRPCAILGADDEVAGVVITSAREAGLRVPEEIAVLGINNDDLWCSSVVPPLSSIGVPAEEVGWRAAQHLDQLIQGNVTYEPFVKFFPPTRIYIRQSTKVVGYSNPIVSEAVQLIRARAPREALTVEQIAQTLHISRQYLSQCFEKHVGHSVKEEVDRVRIDLIREALHSGKSSPKELSNRMGFSDPSQFSRFCRRILGQTPRSVTRRADFPDEDA